MFCPKFILFVIRQLKKEIKITYLQQIGETNKIAIIGNPYAKPASSHLPYVNKFV
jgi:hypothetical protein